MAQQANIWQLPETALKHAEELRKEGHFQQAAEQVHTALQNRRNKGNNIILEKLMLTLIDICIQNQTTKFLKEDIGHFRNLCQHSSMTMLENVLKHLRQKTEQIMVDLKKELGVEKISELLNEQILTSADSDQNAHQFDLEINPEDLTLVAFVDLNEVENKHKLMPKINFYMDVNRIILDSLRQNSKMLDFYNQTAIKSIEFCKEMNCKREFKKFSETLHSHFNQIVKQQSTNSKEHNSKIPFPVRLEEEESLTKVLELRQIQLEVSLQLEMWNDAFKTIENIYLLINRGTHQARIKKTLISFYSKLSQIFWQSKHYVFHCYSIVNMQNLLKTNKQIDESTKALNIAELLLSALSIPLNNKLTNFESLGTQYYPQSVHEQIEDSLEIRNEIFSIAQVLFVRGQPSRQSIMNQIKLKNLHKSINNANVCELFSLLEEEQSPFVISKKGKECIDQIMEQNETLRKYRDNLIEIYSIRIIQKCQAFFKNITFKSLLKYLRFYQTQEQVEKLLFKCNKQKIIKTVIDSQKMCIYYDQDVEVAQNLLSFGNKLRDVFHRVNEVQAEGKNQRERIFMKVKEKLDIEAIEAQDRKNEALRMKEKINETLTNEKRIQELKAREEEEKKKREFEDIQKKDKQDRIKNKIMEELDNARNDRARQVVEELMDRGVNKIKNQKLKDMLNQEVLDYDTILSFYQNFLSKEKEQFEAEKNQRIQKVELWERSKREEDKVSTIKFCQENGAKETEQIKIAIQQRHEKDLKVKKQLEQAIPQFKKFKEQVMAKRTQEHLKAQDRFVTRETEDLQEKIIAEAKSALQKVINMRKVEEATRKRKEATLKKMQEEEQKRKDEGLPEKDDDSFGTGGNEGWNRGAGLQQRREEEQKRAERNQNKPDDGANGFSRSNKNVRYGAEEIKKEPQRNREPEDSGFIRSTMMKKTASDNKQDGFRRNEGKQESTGFSRDAMRKREPQNNQSNNDDGGFQKRDQNSQPRGRGGFTRSGTRGGASRPQNNDGGNWNKTTTTTQGGRPKGKNTNW